MNLRNYIVGLSIICRSGDVVAQMVQEENKDFTYRVVAKDHTQHIVTLRYTGETWESVFQTGRSAHGFSLADTRNCHFSFENKYRMSHVSTTSSKTGEKESIDTPLKLQFSNGYPLFAPYAQELLEFGTTVEAWFGVQKIASIWGTDENAVKKIIKSTVTVIGYPVIRIIGLRSGVNCGEAAPAISSSRNAYVDAMKTNMALLPNVQYYLNSINLLRFWRYQNQNGNFVDALAVYPSKDFPDYMLGALSQWRSLRNIFLAPVDGVEASAPTNGEIADFKKLLADEPNTWIETIALKFSDSPSAETLKEIETRISSSVDEVRKPLPATLLSREIGLEDFTVVFRDYPGPNEGRFYGLPKKEQNAILACGSGKLYFMSFADTSMPDFMKGQNEASFTRRYGNNSTNISYYLERILQIRNFLPPDHERRRKLDEFLNSLDAALQPLEGLAHLANPRNEVFRKCMWDQGMKPPAI